MAAWDDLRPDSIDLRVIDSPERKLDRTATEHVAELVADGRTAGQRPHPPAAAPPALAPAACTTPPPSTWRRRCRSCPTST